MITYPNISDYERAIKQQGSAILNLGEKFDFVVNRITPIKFYNFGSGAFASVFKIKNSKNEEFALRCFLTGGDPKRVERTEKIYNHISKLNEPWLCKSKVYHRGIYVNNHHFPAIQMEWADGKQLNDYVSANLQDAYRLSQLQKKIVELSHSLESLNIAHGDIQSGNIFVEETANDINLKLVDYDAMFIPSFRGEDAVEVGHSSFQHTSRTKSEYNDKIDRFSFWLILTVLESLKFQKDLWSMDFRVGFYDGDSFLFKASDIAAPEKSQLVSRLKSLRQPSVDYYLDKLFSSKYHSTRDKPALFGISRMENSVKEKPVVSKPLQQPVESSNNFKVDANVPNANVFLGSMSGKKLGTTPLSIDGQYASKAILIEKDGAQKLFYLNPNNRSYFIELAGAERIEHEFKKLVSAESIQHEFKKRYQIYGQRDEKIDVTIKDIDTILQSDRNLNLVFVDGIATPLKDIPELYAIKLKYTDAQKTEQTERVLEPITKPAQSESNDVGIWFFVIIVVALIFIIYFLNNIPSNSVGTNDINTQFTPLKQENSPPIKKIEIQSQYEVVPVVEPINPFASKYSLEERASLLLDKINSDFKLENDATANWDGYTLDFITSKRQENGKEFPYIVRGNFDGDSTIDIAFIGRKNGKRKLFIFTNDANGTYWQFSLMDGEAIAYASPDSYSSFAGDGGTNEVVHLQNDGLFRVFFEASASLLYYENGNFKDLLISD